MLPVDGSFGWHVCAVGMAVMHLSSPPVHSTLLCSCLYAKYPVDQRLSCTCQIHVQHHHNFLYLSGQTLRDTNTRMSADVPYTVALRCITSRNTLKFRHRCRIRHDRSRCWGTMSTLTFTLIVQAYQRHVTLYMVFCWSLTNASDM